MDWLLAALNPPYLAGFRDAKKPPTERAATMPQELSAELQIIEDTLDSDWLAGDTFSLADIALGPIVRRCLAFPFERAPMPRLEAWRDRLEARPAFAQAVSAG
jgi:glutathione S-transferase